jgi:branched-subunit amino acid ABC-type transport system permease component
VHPSTLAQAALRGSVTGLGSGLFAIGLVITFRTTRVLNFALGGIASVGGFTMSTLWAAGPVPVLVALPLVMVLGAVLGAAGEVTLRPLRDATVVVKAMAALGLLLVLQAGVLILWGANQRFLPLLVSGGTGFSQVRLAWQQIAAAAGAVAAGLAITVWTARSASGAASLAVAEDPAAAELLGIRRSRSSLTVWVIAGALAALAGVLLSGFTVLDGDQMTLALAAALAAALLAGFSSVPIAIVAAAGVGAVSAMAASVPSAARVSGLVESLGYLAVLAVIVVVRPRRLARTLARA